MRIYNPTEAAELLDGAMQKWGVESQLDMAIEECSELIVAIQHKRRNRVKWDSVIEELADVSLVVDQLKTLAPTAFEEMRQKKMNRLEDLLGDFKVVQK